ncbi:MAG: sigma-70 family RNA polymerase sigma factor [Spirochaetia bacterium]|nr:sigma-70 family RNA polymerase sigma factor [Spirochaetia bacterium]
MTTLTAEMLAESDLDDFLNQHGNRIYTYLCVLCRNEDTASDALQNAYVKFIEQVRRGNVRRESASQYLMIIAKNDHFSRVRREGREVELAEDPVDQSSAANSARSQVAQDVRLVLLETIEDPALPEDLAHVIKLRFLEEADVATICERTGKSQATVYRLMEKALSILADACRRAGIHPEDLGL